MQSKKEKKRHKMSNISEATEKDWEDFWYNEMGEESLEYPKKSQFPDRY